MNKNLFEVQNEVNAMQKQMAALSGQMEAVVEELRAIREQGKGEDKDTYRRIRERASRLPFKGHPLAQVQSEEARRLYLLILAKLALLDEDPSLKEDRLVVIQYVLSQSGLADELEDIVRTAMESRAEVFGDAMTILDKTMYKHLVVDALVMAHIQGEAGETVLRYVSSLCAVLQVKPETLPIYTALAASVLKQNLEEDALSDEQKESLYEELQQFTYYLPQYRIDSSQRLVQEEKFDLGWGLSEVYGCDTKWNVRSGQFVKKGESLSAMVGDVTYCGIKAEKSGKIYIFDGETNWERWGHVILHSYIVITPRYDSQKAVIQWAKEKGFVEDDKVCVRSRCLKKSK